MLSRGIAPTHEASKAWLERASRDALEANIELGYDSVVVSCTTLGLECTDSLRRLIHEEGVQTRFIDMQFPTGMDKTLEKIYGNASAGVANGEGYAHAELGRHQLDVFPVDAASDPEQVIL